MTTFFGRVSGLSPVVELGVTLEAIARVVEVVLVDVVELEACTSLIFPQPTNICFFAKLSTGLKFFKKSTLPNTSSKLVSSNIHLHM